MTAYPQGIEAHHGAKRGVRHATWWRLGILVAILGVALLGFVGGGRSPTLRASSPAASLAVTSPARLRNGMFFETRIAAMAKAPIGDAVIAIPAAMWRDTTVNTLVPAATEEEYVDGEYRFHFGPLDAGERLGFKIDGQLNAPRYGSTRGRLRLLDGTRELAAVPVSLTVIP